MKIIIKNILFLFTVGALFTACKNVDFEDINTNPNEPSKASASGLLASSLRSLGFHTTRTVPCLYVQYLSNGEYPDESRYQILNWSYYSIYSGPLENLNKVIALSSKSTKINSSNTVAVAKLAKAYFFHTMTDRWGYIPYKEALKGISNKQPMFNSQEEVYKGLFKDIDEAIAMINSQPGPDGDIMFKGDMSRWKEFANTLKVVMALRLSKRDTDLGGYAKTQFNKAIGGAIKNTNKNLYFPFISGDENSDNPWEDRFSTRKDYFLSEVMVNFLIGTGSDTNPQDPRLIKFGQPVVETNKYVGAPYGEVNNVNNFSMITKNIIKNEAAPGVIFTAAQVYFSMAEAVELGWMSGSAEDYFKKGIKSSMEQWGVSDTDATTFITSLTYSGIKSIAEQKWVALYMQGYEAWAEWRRIGGPSTIKKPSSQINGSDIPQRQAYGSTVPSLNKVNYDKAINSQGKDDLDTKLWWAK